jgi:hypothetical protein
MVRTRATEDTTLDIPEGFVSTEDLLATQNELIRVLESSSRPPCGFWRIDDQEFDI